MWCSTFVLCRSVLSVDLLSFLTWEAVMETEQLEVALAQPPTGVDVAPCLRRLHLGVTALRELLLVALSFSISLYPIQSRLVIAAIAFDSRL